MQADVLHVSQADFGASLHSRGGISYFGCLGYVSVLTSARLNIGRFWRAWLYSLFSMGTSGVSAFSLVLMLSISCANADVYLNDSQLITLTGSGDTVRPGGIRKVTFNGSTYLLVREIELDKSKVYGHEFLKEWSQLRQSDKVWQPLESLNRMRQSDSDNSGVFSNFVSVLRSLGNMTSTVEEAVSAPMAYETDRFYVIGSVPLESIVAPGKYNGSNPDSKGFLTLAEKPERGNVPTAFWKIRFKASEFNFLTMLGGDNGDSAGADPVRLPRCTGFKRTVSMLEEANGWSSGVWSYEGKGYIDTCIQHYHAVATATGYRPVSRLVQNATYSFQQFSNGADTLTVLVENIGTVDFPLQATIQITGR